MTVKYKWAMDASRKGIRDSRVAMRFASYMWLTEVTFLSSEITYHSSTGAA